ncbi:hypothetical protein Hypma_009459 [Hypsizygus marmoreus]|uniref:F-box domain-containing protein n=1 Tax=Hypsizygus marmoreus TaxID=39966 RepID=A0A369JSJ3_HYPMA|nr:hypothetical protein Hypma_009459 [Hypsizygus marmoreus]
MELQPILPADILSNIYPCLSHKDALALSSVTRMTRLVFLPFVFSKVAQDIHKPSLENADRVLLFNIREVFFLNTSSHLGLRPPHQTFQFLLSLPNLHSLFFQYPPIPIPLLPELLPATKRLPPLHTLELNLVNTSFRDPFAKANVLPIPTTAPHEPPNLKRLRVRSMEYPDEPVSESATRGFLSAVIEPSITTLRPPLVGRFIYKPPVIRAKP